MFFDDYIGNKVLGALSCIFGAITILGFIFSGTYAPVRLIALCLLIGINWAVISTRDNDFTVEGSSLMKIQVSILAFTVIMLCLGAIIL